MSLKETGERFLMGTTVVLSILLLYAAAFVWAYLEG